MGEDLCNSTLPFLNGSIYMNGNNETLCVNTSTAVSQCPPPSLPPLIPVFVNYLQAVIVFAILISSVSLNGFVIFMIYKYKALHKRAFFLGLNLIVAHFVFSVTVLPLMFVSAIATEWLFGDVMCQILGAIHDEVITFRYIFTLVLTIDRMWTIFFPFFYKKYGGKIATVMTLIVWVVATSRAFTALSFIADCYGYLPTFKMCSAAACSRVCLGHTLGYAALLALTGVILPFTLYLMLYWRVKKLQRQMQSATKAGIRIMHSVAVATISEANLERSRPNSVCENSEHNNRVMVTFMTLVLVLVGFALPPYILYTVQFGIQYTNQATPTSSEVLSLLQIFIGRTFIYGLTFTDPIVIMRNQDVRDTFAKIRLRIKGQRRQMIGGSSTAGSYSRRPSQLPCTTFPSNDECPSGVNTKTSQPSPLRNSKVVSFQELNISLSSDSGEREIKE